MEEKPLISYSLKWVKEEWDRNLGIWQIFRVMGKPGLVSRLVAPRRLFSRLASRTRHCESLNQAWNLAFSFAFGVTLPGD